MTHDAQVRIIVGLGNPGPEYEHTYHNTGALSLPFIAAGLGTEENPLAFVRYKKSFAYAKTGTWVFVKPLVYMNESGGAVKDALKVFKAAPGNLAVAHDDSDLTIGSFKIAMGGGAAGHNGIRSIVEQIGTQEFLRIRIGIRAAHEAHRKKAGEFVLSTITPANMKTLKEAFGAAARALPEKWPST